jgi:hypothetical protein
MEMYHLQLEVTKQVIRSLKSKNTIAIRKGTKDLKKKDKTK